MLYVINGNIYKIYGILFCFIQKYFYFYFVLYKIMHFPIFKSLLSTKNSLTMKPTSLMELITPEAIQSFARKNYKTYVAHCEARKLKPMVFHEFLKNYAV